MPQNSYSIGIGIHEITDPAIGLPMQGFADVRQKTNGVESRLYSRAFIVEDKETEKHVVIVSADIWSGTHFVRQEVLTRLQKDFGPLYTFDNVLVSGTHTHSAPGGYAGHRLYDLTGGGFDWNTFECIVSGMVKSIRKAHNNLAPGRIYVCKGNLENCGMNRSMDAYLSNPENERKRYGSSTDKEMLLLKFTRLRENSNEETPIGVLNWFAIHPTDRGQKNTYVCGDNKGHASYLFEKSMRMDPLASETFVAAFANSNAGDVSGNVEFGQIPDGVNDSVHMEKHGKQQYAKAKELFDSANEKLEGSVDYRHKWVDFSNIEVNGCSEARTWPAALGLSFAAGSIQDGIAYPCIGLKEGISESNISITEKIALVIASLAAAGIKGIPTALAFDENVIKGHCPKPILFAVGANDYFVPKILPLQILKIGQFVITAIPGEITTMAGRRLRETVLEELNDVGTSHLALAAYANEYSQYVTTKEEYDQQDYEGASVLFGPWTLHAYQQEFQKLAHALKVGDPVKPGPTPQEKSSPIARRWTIRNLSNDAVTLKFYNPEDKLYLFTLFCGTKKVKAHTEVALPQNSFVVSLEQVKIKFHGANDVVIVAIDDLVTITEKGLVEVSSYIPPEC